MARHSYYAPEYLIKINGEPIPAALRAAVTKVNWNSALDAADKFDFSIHDPKEIWFKNPLLKPENEISLALGYAPDPLEEVFLGEITGQNATFQEGGGVLLTVEAMDKSHRLMGGTKERGFSFLPDSAVVSLVAIEHGLIPMVDTKSAFLSVLAQLLGHARRQANKSDYELLQEIATEMGVQFWVDRNMLYVKKFLEYEPSISANWGQTLIGFSPRLSTVGQIEGVSIKLWLKELKLDLVITLSWDFDNERLNVSVVPSKAEKATTPEGKPILKLVNQPIRDPTDLVQVMTKALSELKKKLNNRITGNGSMIGDIRIRKGSVIKLNGIGDIFSGSYRIKNATHSIDTSGYKVNFQGNQAIIPEFLSV
jgi:phage protein D